VTVTQIVIPPVPEVLTDPVPQPELEGRDERAFGKWISELDAARVEANCHKSAIREILDRAQDEDIQPEPVDCK
jgi:hypothetical protein